MRAQRVAVLGGGNVAMDAARTAMRLGAKEVHLIYRRTEVEMPARVEEVAPRQGRRRAFSTCCRTPSASWATKRQGDGHRMPALRAGRTGCQSGRRRPGGNQGQRIPAWECDTVIVAIGNESNPLIEQTTPGLALNKWGTHRDRRERQDLHSEGVYAGGDIVLGAATVILAMGEGRSRRNRSTSTWRQSRRASKLVACLKLPTEIASLPKCASTAPCAVVLR